MPSFRASPRSASTMYVHMHAAGQAQHRPDPHRSTASAPPNTSMVATFPVGTCENPERASMRPPAPPRVNSACRPVGCIWLHGRTARAAPLVLDLRNVEERGRGGGQRRPAPCICTAGACPNCVCQSVTLQIQSCNCACAYAAYRVPVC